MSIILAGSRGLIGRHVKRMLDDQGVDQIIELDKELGHDLTDENFVREFFKTSGSDSDTLINLFAFNDHVIPGQNRGSLFDLSLESFRQCVEVNLIALFSVCREFARNCQGEGRIINFGASTGIVSPRPDMYNGNHKHVGYSVSKAGVIHLTKILAVHLAPKITVNCISPGGVSHDQGHDFQKLYGSHTPMGKMCHLTELEPAIKMLLDYNNRYMTGTNIIVDGGYVCW